MNVHRLHAIFMQVVRYGVVGILNNLLSYFIYILITWPWLDPKVAVVMMCPVSAVMAYHGHSRYSFAGHSGASYKPLRYFIAHLVGYGANLAILVVFYDWFGFPHQLVQAAAIVFVAGVLYLMFRYFVFTSREVG